MNNIIGTMVYVFAILVFATSGYQHLDYAADGFHNLSLHIIAEMFPIVFLLIGTILISIAAINNFRDTFRAAQFAFWGCVLAWLYYGLVGGAFILAFSTVPLLTISGLIWFVVPFAWLVMTTKYARQRMHKY